MISSFKFPFLLWSFGFRCPSVVFSGRPSQTFQSELFSQPKENIKTFDNNYLQALEQNILNNKAKVRSVSLHSLRDEALEVVGEDEILYKAGHYTNTFQ